MSASLVKLVAVPRQPEPTADPIRFEQAVRAFRARVPMTDAAFRALADRSHNRAFTIAGATKLDLVHEVWESLDKAVADGTTFADFKKQVGEKLERDWGRKNPARLDTIFRTNVQRSYGAGTVAMLREPAVLKRRPIWKYSAIEDGRTTIICQHCDGTVLPADDRWWTTHQPPLHFRCRSHIIGLTSSQADEVGISKSGPNAPPQDGFGSVEQDWQPDLSKYPPELAAVYREKLAAAGAGEPPAGGGGSGSGSGGDDGGGGGDGGDGPSLNDLARERLGATDDQEVEREDWRTTGFHSIDGKDSQKTLGRDKGRKP